MMTWSSIPTLDRVLDEALRSALRSEGEGAAFPVAADIRERNDGYTFQLDVPGVNRDDLEVTLDRRVLTIRGMRRFERGQDEKVTSSRPYGSFVASYALPEGIEGENLTAELADGVLTVRVPKEAKAQARKIPIGSGADPKHLGG